MDVQSQTSEARRDFSVQMSLVFPYSPAQLDYLPHQGTHHQKRKLVPFSHRAVLKV